MGIDGLRDITSKESELIIDPEKIVSQGLDRGLVGSGKSPQTHRPAILGRACGICEKRRKTAAASYVDGDSFISGLDWPRAGKQDDKRAELGETERLLQVWDVFHELIGGSGCAAYSWGIVQVEKVESVDFLMKNPCPEGIAALGTSRRPSYHLLFPE